MKNRLLVSSLIATSLVSVGSQVRADGNSGDSSSEAAKANDILKTIDQARVAGARVYETKESQKFADENIKKVSVLILSADPEAIQNKRLTQNTGEMILRIEQKDGETIDYGNGADFDLVYFYFKPTTEDKSRFSGFACNSSKDCDLGDTFSLKFAEDKTSFQVENYKPAIVRGGSEYFPMDLLGIEFFLK